MRESLHTDIDDLSLGDLPDCNRRGHVHVEGPDDAELRDLKTEVHFLKVLHWDTFFFFAEQ